MADNGLSYRNWKFRNSADQGYRCVPVGLKSARSARMTAILIRRSATGNSPSGRA